MDYDRLRELQEKFEENPRRYFAPLANEYRKGGQPKRAIEICRAQLAQMPGHMSGLIVFGQALYETSEFKEAREVFERALALDPENLIALRSLGDMSLQSGDTREARSWYKRLLEADPKDTAVIALVSEIEESADASPVAPPPGLAIDRDGGDQAIPFIADATGAPIGPEAEPPAPAPSEKTDAAPPLGLERHYPVEPPILELIAPQAAAPEPVTPQVAASQSTASQSASAETTSPEPETPELMQPEPATPTPVRPAFPPPPSFEDEIPMGAEGLKSAIAPDNRGAESLRSLLKPTPPLGTEAISATPRPAAPTETAVPSEKPRPAVTTGAQVPTEKPRPVATIGTEVPSEKTRPAAPTEVPSEKPRPPIPAATEPLSSKAPSPEPTGIEGLSGRARPGAPAGAEGLSGKARSGGPTGTEGLKGKAVPSPLEGAASSRSDDETAAEAAALDEWTPPPGANLHERGESSKDEEMVTMSSPEPFVNETMAQLYLQQGYRQLALKVYYQLAEARPNDQGLKDRIAQIEAADRAAHPEAVEARERPSPPPAAPRSPSIEAPTPGSAPESEESPSFDRTPIDSPPSRPSRGRESIESPTYDEPRAEPEGIAARQPSIKEFFATLGRRRPPRQATPAATSMRPPQSAPLEPMPPPPPATAGPPASLDAVFAGATVNPADSRAASRLAGAFSGGTGATSRTPPTPPTPTPRVNPRLPQAQESEEDVAKFRAWLDGLTGE